jgi:hypothetical protein
MASNIITADRYLTICCKAFSGQGVREHRILVEADRVDGNGVKRGMIRVWDDVAGHFTGCHSISERTQQRIRRTFQPD